MSLPPTPGDGVGVRRSRTKLPCCRPRVWRMRSVGMNCSSMPLGRFRRRHADADDGADARADHDTDTGADHGADTRADHGTDTGADHGADTSALASPDAGNPDVLL